MLSIPRRERGFGISELQAEAGRLLDRCVHRGLSFSPLDGMDWAPPIDLADGPDAYVLCAEVPGLRPADIEVSVCGRTLTIKGHKHIEGPNAERANFLRTERPRGDFHRTLDLPTDVDVEKVSAQCKEGVLQVVLPKVEAAKTTSVKVPVEG